MSVKSRVRQLERRRKQTHVLAVSQVDEDGEIIGYLVYEDDTKTLVSRNACEDEDDFRARLREMIYDRLGPGCAILHVDHDVKYS